MAETNNVNRRVFLKNGMLVLAGAGLAAPALLDRALAADEGEEGCGSAAETSDVVYRTLGRTELKVTAVSVGAMNCSDPRVLQRAMDLGVNFIDTAASYGNGRNEQMVAEAIAGKRDKMLIESKVSTRGGSEGMNQLLNRSLENLKTDYVDVLLLHSLGRTAKGLQGKEKLDAIAKQIGNPVGLDFLAEAKKAGKARFVGFSTHSNMTECLNIAAENDVIDVVLTAYKFNAPEDLTRAVKFAASKGKGIVAMKTQGGGYETGATQDLNPHQAALKWALGNPAVHTTIPGVRSIQEVDEDVAVMKHMAMTWNDRVTLNRYMEATAGVLCAMCGACEGTCPYGVAIPDVNRCLMYAEGYGDMDLARSQYEMIEPSRRASACADCRTCTARCVNRLVLGERMAKARELFA